MVSGSRFICAALISGVLLDGCAMGGSADAPATTLRSNASRSFMLPEARNDTLTYVSDQSNGVMVYSYPPYGFKFVGMLNGVTQPMGECVDAKQNLWVTENTFTGNHLVFEYAHGGVQPIDTLSVPGTPIACSVNRNNGDLAVVAYPPILGDQVVLSIFRRARGRPQNFTYPQFGMQFCAYDDTGDLFVDGYVSSGQLHLAELPRGAKAFTSIDVSQTFSTTGALQWVDKHLAIGDYDAIYRFSIDGNTATEVSSTPLNVGGNYSPGQFVIDRGRTIVPYNGDDYAGFVDVYRFPKGGTPTRTLPNFSEPYAVVISRGPKP